ncbi:MAG: MOSC domain-containing protein [Paracoccaceae bacterium]|nr:MOSC domain-containing protein [Paracoccaceae bacterium]
MPKIADLLARHHQDGRIAWIGLRPARRSPMVLATEAGIALSGLEGDHGRSGKRAVTLIQAEHLEAIGAYMSEPPIAPERLRRNFVISGLNLAALRGRRLQVGTAVLHITGPCAPCSRMEEELGHGGYNAMRGHGGWCAEVERAGVARLGDSVHPVEPSDGTALGG